MDTDVIHGDIKPQNVLVFNNATDKSTVKVADFGYSTLAIAEEGKVFLPKSRPWNAPEHHFREFTLLEAKKTDVYSFGMLCLWVLFANNLPDIPQTTAEGSTELISFGAPYGPRTLLEQIKDDDKVEGIAYEFMQTMPDLNDEQKIKLQKFFSLTVSKIPDGRTSDIGKLLGLLRHEQ